MQFQELKRIADAEDALSQIQETQRSVRQRSQKLMEIRAESLVHSIRQDFERFFSEQGFKFCMNDREITAEYKTLRISLIRAEPGRRKEDIPCLLRFYLRISGTDTGNFQIFVKWADPQVDPGTLDNKQFPSADTETTAVLQNLKSHKKKLEILEQFIQKSKLEFNGKRNIARMNDLSKEVLVLKNSMEEELGKWHRIFQNQYAFYIPEFQIDSEESTVVFSDLYAFLSALDRRIQDV